jgi:hypothetical protein
MANMNRCRCSIFAKVAGGDAEKEILAALSDEASKVRIAAADAVFEQKPHSDQDGRFAQACRPRGHRLADARILGALH